MRKNSKFRFTVFTPTYNCGHLIHRVFNSLKKQTFRDFEWIVIDDGSTDNTEKIIELFKKSADFPIIYEYQKNSGKPAATNKAVKMANGELFITADADDEFIEDTLKIFNKYYESYLKESNLSHICCNCLTQFGELHGDKFPESPWIANEFKMCFEKKIAGEKWAAVKIEIMKEFPFNDIVDKFVPESHFWYAVANKYDALFINENLRIYYVNQEDYKSLSSDKKIKFPKGRRFRDMEVINKYYDKVKSDKKFLKKTFVDYIRMSVHSKVGFFKMFKDIKALRNKILLILFLPFGYKKAFSDKIKGRV
jgi:glycosyltransferase involved in cell wall biosynthesis